MKVSAIFLVPIIIAVFGCDAPGNKMGNQAGLLFSSQKPLEVQIFHEAQVIKMRLEVTPSSVNVLRATKQSDVDPTLFRKVDESDFIIETVSEQGVTIFRGGVPNPLLFESEYFDPKTERWDTKEIRVEKQVFELKIPFSSEVNEIRFFKRTTQGEPRTEKNLVLLELWRVPKK